MGSAVGQYVNLANAKQRLLDAGVTDNSNNALIQSIADETNSWIENKTGRILCPIPPFSGTFSGTKGSNAITISSSTGLAIGDSLLLGPLSGTHEQWDVMAIGTPTIPYDAWAATTVYADGDIVQPVSPNTHTYIAVIAGTSGGSEPSFPTDGTGILDGTTLVWVDQGVYATSNTVTLRGPLANTYASQPCQRIYINDGFDAGYEGRVYILSRGFFNLAALEVATYTNGAFAVIPQSDYFQRPAGIDLTPGWPFLECWMTNIPSPQNQTPVFYPGFSNARFIGPGPCVGLPDAPGFGWPAMPDDVVDVGLKSFMAAFRQRASSGGDTFTVNLDGTRVYERALSYEDKMVIERYRVKTIGDPGATH